MMSIVSVIIVMLGQVSIDVGLAEKQSEVDDFAQSILKEFEILQVVEGGYNRTFIISDNFMERFNVTFDEYYLIVEDLYTYESGDEFSRTYRIPGEFNITTFYDPVLKNLKITLFKPYISDFDGISIK